MRKKFVDGGETLECGKRIIRDVAFSVFRRQSAGLLRSVRFSENRSFGFGTFGADLSKRVSMFDICIGIGPYGTKENLSDTDFVKFVTTGMHEIAHLQQYLNGFDTCCSENLLFVLLANRHNFSCYNLGQNYSSDLSEVNAEIDGILMSKRMLEPIFGNRIEELLTDYVNGRILEFRQSGIESRGNYEENGRKYHGEQNRLYFFDKGKSCNYLQYRDFSEILEAIPKLKQDTAMACRTYPDWMLEHRDEFLCVTRPAIWKPFLESFQTAPDQTMQARMQASVWAWLYPDEARRFPAIQIGMLEPKTVFGIDFPEDKGAVLSRIPNFVYVRPKFSNESVEI